AVPAINRPSEPITIKNGRALPLPRRVLLLTGNSWCCLGSRDREGPAGLQWPTREVRPARDAVCRGSTVNKGDSMSATSRIPVGASAEKGVTVTREMTVAHYHESMPEVFGTPVMIYHMEVTASDAVQPHLPEGWVSVGVAVNVRHLAATPVGM